MVDGEIGQSGTNVLLVAVVGTKEGQDHAITQRHNSEATIVPLMAHLLLKAKDAMKPHVLVCAVIPHCFVFERKELKTFYPGV